MDKKSIINRILAVLLLVPILFSLLPTIPSYAADSQYIETLIDEDNLTYNTNIVLDTNGKNSKYEYKYSQIGSYIKNACGSTSTPGIKGSYDNANYCYNLTTKLEFPGSIFTSTSTSGTTLSTKDNWISGASSTTGVTQGEFFMRSEGFFDDTLQPVSKKENAEPLLPGDTPSGFYSASSKNSNIMMFEYPAIPGAKGTTKESNYAVEIGSTLTSSLNQILNVVNNGKKYGSVSQLINKSILIRPVDENNIGVVSKNSSNTDGSAFVLVYAPNDKDSVLATNTVINDKKKELESLTSNITFKTANEFFTATKLPKTDENGNLLVYVLSANDGVTSMNFTLSNTPSGANQVSIDSMSYFAYAMPKGYKSTPEGAIKFPDSKGLEQKAASEDIPFITIHMLAQNANNMYKQFGLSLSTVDHTEEQGTFEKIIYNLLSGLVNGITSILGLSSVNDLVYNGGLRSSSQYNYGTMTSNWWNGVIRYHLLFQAIAWFIIIVGFLKTLISLNLSTINPQRRSSVYNEIGKFIITGFSLVLIIPTIQFCMALNSSVVGIFASQVDVGLKGAPQVGGLAGIVVVFAYFAIDIYINFIYIMRSITIALLIVSAPFFLATMSISNTRSKMMMSWAKELLANIFLQSVHAFSLAFLGTLMQSGTGIESLVISFSIIPITEMFRGLILAGGAGTTSGLAKEAAAKATAFTSSAIGAFAGGAAGALSGGMDGSAVGAEEGAAGGAKSGAGGKGKGGEPGFAALNGSVNRNISSLRQNGLKDIKADDGHVGRGVAKVGGSLAASAAKGGLKGVAGLTNMMTQMAMSEFTGNPMGYGAAGGIVGGMGASMASGLSEGIQQGYQDRKNGLDYDANDTKASPQDIAAIDGGSTPNGNQHTTSAPQLDKIASMGGSAGELASKIQAAAGGDKAASNWLSYKGITGVKSGGPDGSGSSISYNVGMARGSADAVSTGTNGSVLGQHSMLGGKTSTFKDKGQTFGQATYDSKSFEAACASCPSFEAKFGEAGRAALAGGPITQGFSGGHYSMSGDKLNLNFEGAEGSKDGTHLITHGTDADVRNLFSMNDGTPAGRSINAENASNFNPSAADGQAQ